MKNFSIIAMLLFALTACFLGTALAEPCATCHDSASAEGLTLDIHPNFNVPQMVSGAGSGTFIAGKTSRSIEPFFTADIPGQPYPYTQSDYLEEPGNPITDEENLYAGTALTKIKLE